MHWSLRPLERPTVPPVATVSATQFGPQNAVDAFLRAKLAEHGMAPSPEADRRTLLRRLYFDLIGLPPTPDAMEAVVSDSSPDAWERVVDQLLASPRYGERWARHWLDLVHYAETHGHDQDRVRTNAWPYRDYVIRALNRDKPYARFMQEQIAGDVLFPSEPQAVAAMGFLATGPWDESSLRDIRDDTIDREIARYIDRDDIATTVMQTFTSTTVQCARCHDHKFDPITQAEYYGLQAVFAATDKANRYFDTDPKIHSTRQALLKRKRAIERKDATLLVSLREPSARAEMAAWENALPHRAVAWTVLELRELVSSNGVTFSRLEDGSVLSSGTRPETDTYTVTARWPSALPRIAAFRLEVMTDDSLPKKGPGRQDNGNLHLTDFKAAGASVSASTNLLTDSKPLPLENPTADFNQDGWEIAKAIDADPRSAWGIFPAVGKSHQAVFELKDEWLLGGTTNSAASRVLQFTLAQNHGGGHLIGRFRLSATAAPRPVRANLFPENIAKILATPALDRTEAQRDELAWHIAREEVERRLAALPKPEVVYAGASDFVPDGSFKPALAVREVRVLQRGDIHKPGAAAVPGALACVGQLPATFRLPDPADEGARRAALARWISDPQNPLTWRSIVNRVWHHHFGRGLVDTPNDFGRMGTRPSHPELLDWLACEFRDGGGSFKQLHRLIVTSAAYRQISGSEFQASNSGQIPEVPIRSPKSEIRNPSTLDPDNRWLWRMNRSRLDAEQVRDAVLQISGKLDLAMGGPSVMQFVMSPGIHVTPRVEYDKFDVDSPASFRRSIYRFVFRTLPDPFMDTLDCADASQLTAVRSVSITPLQALATLNNPFMVRQSEHFAARLGVRSSVLESQVEDACRLALLREPTTAERAEFTRYARQHGLANLCRLIWNSNEFMFVN